jgi:hypothetical protein
VRGGWRNLAGVALACALLAATAKADETKVDIVAEVVHASPRGNTVDPPQLEKMKNELAQKGLRFTSLKRLSQKTVAVQKGKAEEVGLPDGRRATLSLIQLKDDAATVKVTVAQRNKPQPLLETTYRLARDKSTFIHCGAYKDGELFLVLSPP